MSVLPRLLQNAFAGWFRLGRWFPPAVLERLRAAVASGESGHFGEICFAVESRLPLAWVWHGRGARARAEQAFAQLRVWDTAQNTGVLVYVLLSERRVEIVADRGIAARVAQDEWERICAALAARFAGEEPEQGVRDAITAIHALLERHFPTLGQANPNERPDAPVVL
jgi:uncharacterized membrane protein